MQLEATSPAHPICYLAVSNEQARAQLAAELTDQGWRVIPKPTGFHLLADLSGAILGDQPTPADLVIVEDRLPGCRGSSIAEGLRALGITIPVRVIDADDQWPPLLAA